MHSWTTSSGALAPAVIRTVSTPSNHSERISETPSIRWACGPRALAISASRRLLELFWLPSTSTTSPRVASSRTASWRFWVA